MLHEESEDPMAEELRQIGMDEARADAFHRIIKRHPVLQALFDEGPQEGAEDAPHRKLNFTFSLLQDDQGNTYCMPGVEIVVRCEREFRPTTTGNRMEQRIETERLSPDIVERMYREMQEENRVFVAKLLIPQAYEKWHGECVADGEDDWENLAKIRAAVCSTYEALTGERLNETELL